MPECYGCGRHDFSANGAKLHRITCRLAQEYDRAHPKVSFKLSEVPPQW